MAKRPPAATHDPLARIFGVRHLSPAGARHLETFLREVEPTAILIEGPSDAGNLLPHLVHCDTRPPVALLAFTSKRPVRSLMYPLAAYSPEWVALTTGLATKIPVRLIDLPAATFLALQERREQAKAGDERPHSETAVYLDDPYAEIARLAGDPDHETWWERHFEHTLESEAYRGAIHEFGSGLRSVRAEADDLERETFLREAYMRRAIRATLDEGHDPTRVVVVCGAYHGPALVRELPPMTDQEAAALPVLETHLTLMPYSYYRLSSQSGYGAGNHAPRYYQVLWEEAGQGRPDRLAARYTSELAGWLRRAGTIRSSAEVIEAVRLASGLAALNGSSAPTLRDLRDAATTCLGGGDFAAIARWVAEVEVGDAVGALPPGVARTSLQEDFYYQIADLRLEEYLKDRVQTIQGATGKPWLDRRLNRQARTDRTATRDRRRSIFLHRLALLGIDFAREITDAADRAASTYKEAWEARWTPECEIALAEASLGGDTVQQAAVRALRERLDAAEDIGAAAALARQAVDCDLEAGMALALRRVQALAVDAAALGAVAVALYELAALVRYREVTEIDVTPLQPLVAQLFLRAALLAPGAAACDDQAMKDMARALENVHVVAFLPVPQASLPALPVERWVAALTTIADDRFAHPFLSGMACALLLERGLAPEDAVERRVTRRLSPGASPEEGAWFFEGLASRNRMALLGRTHLWRSMTGFIETLDPPAFLRALPGLRRAFASFTLGESRRIAGVLATIWDEGAGRITAAVEVKIDAAELEALAAELGDMELGF